MAIAACVTPNCTIREALGKFLMIPSAEMGSPKGSCSRCFHHVQSRPTADQNYDTKTVVRRFSDISCGRIGIDTTAVSTQVITSIFTGLAVIFFILRVLSRWQSGLRTSWGADDWLILPAVTILIANYAYGIVGCTKSLSADLWWLTPDEIDMVLYASYVAMLMYLMVVTFTKLSVLAFYLQIFPSRTFRNWTFALMACNVAFMIAIVFATVFRCWPIEGAWLAWDGTFQGRCFDLNPLVWAGALLTIFLDTATLLLPMPALWKLNMSIKKRVQIMLMFGIGAL